MCILTQVKLNYLEKPEYQSPAASVFESGASLVEFVFEPLYIKIELGFVFISFDEV